MRFARFDSIDIAGEPTVGESLGRQRFCKHSRDIARLQWGYNGNRVFQ